VIKARLEHRALSNEAGGDGSQKRLVSARLFYVYGLKRVPFSK
jgi:hypothetical protein